ncbi:hypothetical protein [Pedobacter xixiisoli]|uniref:Uncharacterized protein n=1 Tax=Pedobacter xixiisoli TaxID=1476464 RepID=A0A286ADL8_9SPHI|nr:hypothetical protein [Pedobacter xixiisoli]SOD19983.1 hypothetical protein SAMN06297358_3691 [Pedobacter xixiisoli]
MKTRSTLTVLLISTQISFAQESKLWLSLGAGVNQASNQNKNILMGNGANLQLDAFVPFYRKGWDGTVKGGSFALGLNVLGNYARIKNLSPNNSNIESQYQIHNATLSVASSADSKNSASFSGLIGLQGRFLFGKFNVAPSVNAGYLNFKKEGYEQIGSASINGQARQLELTRVEEQSSGGFVFKPQIKVGYNLTSNLSVFISPAMVMGHEVAHTVQQRVPQGGFNDRNTYEASQLANGTWESKTTTSKYNFSELNFGLSVALGKKKAKTASGNARQTPNTSFGQRVEANQQAAVNNPLYKDKETQGNNPMYEQKAIVTTAKQTQGKTFGESMAGGLQAAGNTAVSPAGKATMKEFSVTKKTETAATENVTEEGTRENGVASAERRRVEVLKSNKTGDPNKYAIGNEGENATSENSAAMRVATLKNKDVKRNDVSAENLALPAKSEVTDFNTTRNNKERGQLVAAPGTPIGGIVVKGGKNPGGNMRLISNGNGEIALPNLQKGNYLFQLSGIEPAEKSIGEKGIKRGEAAAIAKPGNPIGGIIVKGGKNPGGNYINLTINDKGQVGFEVLETNDYKLIIQTPEAPNKEAKKKKVVEKATSGLKDTLKTNV